ncbi:hypothetical protein OO25_20815 [Phaeobacter sp. S60]|nr:hypothetical protein OO25_20815 [Phaeobacter sp. S60]
MPRGTILIGGDTAQGCSMASLKSIVCKFDPFEFSPKPSVGEDHTIGVASATSYFVEVPLRSLLAFWKLSWVGCSVVHNVEKKKLAKAKAA